MVMEEELLPQAQGFDGSEAEQRANQANQAPDPDAYQAGGLNPVEEGVTTRSPVDYQGEPERAPRCRPI